MAATVSPVSSFFSKRPLFNMAPPDKQKKKKKPFLVQPPAPEEQPEAVPLEATPSPRRFLWVLVAAVCAVVVYIMSKVVRFGKKPETEAPEELAGEEERYEAEKRAYEIQRQELRMAYKALLDKRDQVVERLRKNWEDAQRNQQNFKGLFSATKASYDEDITGYEEEQSLNTAFMLKSDLDDRKQNMIKAGEDLGKEKEHLVSALKDTDARLSQAIHMYNQSYDDKLPDPRQRRPQQQQEEPPADAAVDQAKRDYRQRADPDDRERLIRDGTGREQMPN